MKKPRNKRTPNLSKLENLKHLNLNAAGFDIGATAIDACVPADRDALSVRVFQT